MGATHCCVFCHHKMRPGKKSRVFSCNENCEPDVLLGRSLCNLQIQSFIMMENEIHVKSPKGKKKKKKKLRWVTTVQRADQKSLVLHYYITKLASSQSIKVRRRAQRKSTEDVQSQFEKEFIVLPLTATPTNRTEALRAPGCTLPPPLFFKTFLWDLIF